MDGYLPSIKLVDLSLLLAGQSFMTSLETMLQRFMAQEYSVSLHQLRYYKLLALKQNKP
jgi:hypothetical protein